VGESERQKPFGKPWPKWEDNVKIDLKLTRQDGVDTYNLQISRSWFRASSMIIMNKNQPDAH
jgi:hypothetical protein